MHRNVVAIFEKFGGNVFFRSSFDNIDFKPSRYRALGPLALSPHRTSHLIPSHSIPSHDGRSLSHQHGPPSVSLWSSLFSFLWIRSTLKSFILTDIPHLSRYLFFDKYIAYSSSKQKHKDFFFLFPFFIWCPIISWYRYSFCCDYWKWQCPYHQNKLIVITSSS